MSVNSSRSGPIKINESMTTIAGNAGASINSTGRRFSVSDTIMQKGYGITKKIAKTLQGSVWKVRKNGVSYVIKATKKALHHQAVTIQDGKAFNVKENILKETAILRYLTANNPPDGLAKFIDFFCDKHYYYLVMEDGGTSFFHFVVKCHEFIKKGRITISHWHKVCKMLFRQMLEVLDWMHTTMNCCHLDISLENFVISDAQVAIDSKGMIKFDSNIRVKLVDFGLAEVFKPTNFACKKYVGKQPYKAPKVFGKREIFDPRKADVWSLSVSLFMMIIGLQPYVKPINKDPLFNKIMSRQFIGLFNEWKKIPYINARIIDLMRRLFTKEKYRLTIKEIKQHPWLL